MSQTVNQPMRMDLRKALLVRDLADAHVELAELRGSLDRYEKAIEIPRVLEEIRRVELEIEEIESA